MKLRLDAKDVLTWEIGKGAGTLPYAHLQWFAKEILRLLAANRTARNARLEAPTDD